MPITTLTLILHIFIGSTLAGTGVIVALTMGVTGVAPILIAALAGFVLAAPVSWYVAKQIAQS